MKYFMHYLCVPMIVVSMLHNFLSQKPDPPLQCLRKCKTSVMPPFLTKQFLTNALTPLRCRIPKIQKQVHQVDMVSAVLTQIVPPLAM